MSEATVSSAHPITAAVEEIETALDGCAGAPGWSLDPGEALALIERMHALLSRLEGTALLPAVERARATAASTAPTATPPTPDSYAAPGTATA